MQPIMVLATGNSHKCREIQSMLSGEWKFMTLKDLNQPPEVIEDAPTFEGNALKKAISLANWLRDTGSLPVDSEECYTLADDSGLEVDALHGAPGVKSARYAALDAHQNSDDGKNNEKLLRNLETFPIEQRAARFQCVLALIPMRRDSSGTFQCLKPVSFHGTCEGTILFEASGHQGFGYDPLFRPLGHSVSFGELPSKVKNQISHRSKALSHLKKYFEECHPGSV